MAKGSKRSRKQRQELKRAISHKPLSVAPTASESDHSQSPPEHVPHHDPDDGRKFVGLSPGRLVSMIIALGSAAFLNHISGHPYILYFCAFAVCFWLAWEIRGVSKLRQGFAACACFVLLIGTHAVVRYERSSTILDRRTLSNPTTDDLLIPADEPNPPLPAGWRSAPSNSAMLFTAGSVFVMGQANPTVILKYNKESLLQLKLSEKGALLSGKFFGRNGDVVAVLRDNRIILNRDNVLEFEKDKNSLVIRDKRDFEVINVRHVNRFSFTLTGRMWLPDGGLVELDKDEMRQFPTRPGSKPNRFSNISGQSTDTLLMFGGPVRR